MRVRNNNYHRARVPILCLGLAILSTCSLWEDPPPIINRSLDPADTKRDGSAVFTRTIIARSDHAYPPFEFINAAGEPDGFNIELLRRIASIMHLDIRIDLGPWDTVRSQLERGEIDMLAGMYKTPERAELVDFTIPHFTSMYSLFAPKNSGIRSLQDLDGKRLAVQTGDIGHDFIKKSGSAAIIVEHNSWEEIFTTVSSGRAEAAISAMLQGLNYVREGKFKDIDAVGEPLFQEMYCMAVRKGDAELLAALNEGLSILKSSGEYDSLFDKWFTTLSKSAYQDRIIARHLLFALVIAAGVFLLLLGWTFSLRLQVRRKTAELSAQLEAGNRIRQELQEALAEAERLRHIADDANRSKSVFLAHISHELRTPLHGMLAMNNLLADSDLNPDQLVLLKNQRAAALQLERLLTDLLDLTRGAAGNLSLDNQTFKLGDLGLWTREALQQTADQKGLALNFQIDSPDTLVSADLSRLNQILINLATNAIKYTKQGSVGILVRLQAQATGNADLWLEVRDTGPGIKPADKARIFQAFVQGENSLSGSAIDTGVGLGLAIVKMLVKLMRGSIEVRDANGSGSVFLVRIPVSLPPPGQAGGAETQGAEKPGTEARPPSKAPTSSPRKLRILIAEDEALNILYLTRLFSKDGHVVTGVGTGTAAVQARAAGDFDLILMDIGLPEMNGMDATRAIRQWEEQNGRQPVPIAALTAHAYEQDREKCLASGMNGFLTKPFSEQALRSEIIRLTHS